MADDGIPLRLDSSAPRLACKQRELPKNVRVFHGSDINVLVFDWILDVNLAVSRLYDVDVLSFVTLNDQRKLRIKQLQLKSFDKEVDQLVIILKNLTVFDFKLENELDNLVLETRAHGIVKVFKLLLTIL